MLNVKIASKLGSQMSKDLYLKYDENLIKYLNKVKQIENTERR